jgi:hypothetical protein
VLLGGVLIGRMIKEGSSKEPSFHFFGTFLESSQKRSMPISVDGYLRVFDQPVNDLCEKEVAGKKLLPPQNRVSIERSQVIE